MDRVNLFGADVSRTLKRYRLTVAYVSLEVGYSERNGESGDRIPVERALARTSRSAIIGEAGSGKTTLLQWLAVNSAANSFGRELSSFGHTVPFLIELRRYVEDPPPPEDFITQIVPEIADQMPDLWVHDILKSGRALLLVDGLDEVAPNKRETVLDWLDSIVFSYPDVTVVFTSRPAAYERGWLDALGFEEFILAPMRYPDIEMFVNYWHKAVLVDQDLETDEEAMIMGMKLLEKLRNSLPLIRLANNPLLCAMLCALHYERQMQLPSDRNALYEACISMLLERRDIEREIELKHYPELTYKQKRVLLDDLAYWTMKNGYSSVQTTEAIGRMNLRLRNMRTGMQELRTDKILSMLIERSGIIRQPSLGMLDWVHRTFQEYMAASAASSEGDWGLLAKNATDDQWQEVIILAAGFGNREEASTLIGKLLDLAQQNVEKRAYLNLLAVSCLETSVEISPDVRKRVDSLLHSLIPPADRAQEKHLAAAGNLAIPYLNARDTYSGEEAAACVRVLGMIGTRPALAGLRPYVCDQRKVVTEATRNALRLLTAQDLFASGLTEELKETLVNYIDGSCMRLDGTLLYALSAVPVSELRAYFPPEVSRLELIDFRPSNMFVMNLLPNLRYLLLSGDLAIDFESLFGLELSSLDLRCKGYHWPNFRNAHLFGSLESLYLMMEPDAIQYIPWPAFYELCELPNLTRLSIFVEYSDDLPDLRELTCFRKLKYMHLAVSFGPWPDLESLAQLSNLEEIELSSSSCSIPNVETCFGMEALEGLRQVTFSVNKISSKLSRVMANLENYGPNCEIVIREGWSMENW